jgi:acetylornithine deacetylase/succinyl-diaminopimelate desuccinylase-like protein
MDNSHAQAQLLEWLAIPSVSTAPEHAADVRRAAMWLHQHFVALGCSAEILETPRHPAVYAERMVDASKPTLLVYGHYDVQPADPLDEWHTPPFSPTLRDGFIYARGASDDKGQVWAHVAAVSRLLSAGELPLNLKFLIEGEEEIGSPNLAALLAEHAARLRCDAIAISDGAMFAPGVPTITTALRGLCYMELHVTGANSDLHSGGYGGAVANPLNALCTIIAKLKDEHGQILVPGVFDAVLPTPEAERQAWAKLPFDEAEYAQSLAVDALPGEAGYSVLERLWARPTLDVHGIWGGFQGEGQKTVLPNKAGAKISMRLVANQQPKAIYEQVRDYVATITPPGVKAELRYLHSGSPVLIDAEQPAVQAAARAVSRAFAGREVAFTRGGGSIPIVANFVEMFQVPVLLVDLGWPDDGLHGPNERFHVSCLENGIEVAMYLYGELATALAAASAQ